jgi:DNA-directed RNA polymerase subunit RPC12/RpoP
MKTIAYIAAGILIFFGVLFIWGSFSEEGQPSWIVIGVISVAIGFGLIWFASRRLTAPGEQKVTYDVQLSGDVQLEKFQCQNCGGALSSKNVSLIAGAPTVTCPYCGIVYQLEEKPKW